MNSPIKWHGKTTSPIPGATGYFACEDGTILSARRGGNPSPLQPDCRKEDGRKRYTIRCTNGGYRRSYGSHYVLEAFTGPRPDGMEACHNDGNCLNDSISNLRWDTAIANKADMRRHGTQVCGTKVQTNKLTESQVREIRERRDSGAGVSELAGIYGVTAANISCICKGKTWKHLL